MNTPYTKYLICICICSLHFGCQPDIQSSDNGKVSNSLTVGTEYLQIQEHDTYYHVIISFHNSTKKDEYVFYEDKLPSVDLPGAVFIKIPVESAVCQGTGHLGYMEYLNKEHLISAVACAPYVHSQKLNERIKNEKIHIVGDNNGLNYEMLQVLKPSVVLMNSFDDATERMIEQLKTSDIPVIVTTEYFENHPLAKAEWIKLYALLTGYENIDQQFESLSARYEGIVSSISLKNSKPTVMLGLPWKGEWFVAGGNSFQAKIISDAGGEYIWNELDSKGAQVLDIEVVIEKCLNAKVWMNPGDKNSLSDIKEVDQRFSSFFAFKNGNVINNNKRMNDEGVGNDYWESGIMEPDTVLLDVMHLLGTKQDSRYIPKYYHQLK